MLYERKTAWGPLLRLYHWSFALSILALAVTGFYIHAPWTSTANEGSGSFPMADWRYYHFVAGYVFTAAVLVRLYLLVFGNREERFLGFAPVTGRNIKNVFTTLAYYLYLTDRGGHRLGHNALAGTFYLFTLLFAVFQMISGFSLLYPESGFWQTVAGKIFGVQQEIRFYHFVFMWYFLTFALVHVYIVAWNDVWSPEGLISSIFTGDKFLPKGQEGAGKRT